MSSISSIGSAASAWPSASAARAARPPGGPDPAGMFAKVDTDGSGGVDETELQSLLDKVSKRSGTGSATAASSADTFKQFDTNGDGTLSQDELDAGMKSLMPAPSSTVEFAQARGGEAGGPPPGGPPPASGANASYDPLDTNQDGVVSAEEQAAGDAAQASLESLLSAVDSNQDGELSGSEIDTFEKVLADQLDTALASAQSGSKAEAGATPASFDLNALVGKVLKQYADMASAAQQNADSRISLAA